MSVVSYGAVIQTTIAVPDSAWDSSSCRASNLFEPLTYPLSYYMLEQFKVSLVLHEVKFRESTARNYAEEDHFGRPPSRCPFPGPSPPPHSRVPPPSRLQFVRATRVMHMRDKVREGRRGEGGRAAGCALRGCGGCDHQQAHVFRPPPLSPLAARSGVRPRAHQGR